MINRWQWVSAQINKKLWVKSAGLALTSVSLAVMGGFWESLLLESFNISLGQQATLSILNILASSMLAVTTFSLSIMVTAFSGASNVSPRATELLQADRTSHNILAIFIGAFLFSLAGLILIHLGFYNEKNEFILFLISIVMVSAVVVAILRWVDHLTNFGRMGDTVNRLEKVTTDALTDRLKNPFLGGTPLLESPSPNIELHPIFANDIGYIEFIDMDRLNRIAVDHNCDLYLDALPGSFIHHGAPLLHAAIELDEQATMDIQSAILINYRRNFMQDPRFGIAVLTEVVCRSLSASSKDPGTPIDIIGRIVRIFSLLAERETSKTCDILYAKVHVPAINIGDYFDDFFAPVARDADGLVEVHIRLHKALNALKHLGDPGISREVDRVRVYTLDYATANIRIDRDLSLINSIAN